MGYDVNRFEGSVDEELICPICSAVLEDPRLAPEWVNPPLTAGQSVRPVISRCEHAFCADCIVEWLNRQQTCPVDRSSISIAELRPVPRILKNLLSRLEIRWSSVGSDRTSQTCYLAAGATMNCTAAMWSSSWTSSPSISGIVNTTPRNLCPVPRDVVLLCLRTRWWDSR